MKIRILRILSEDPWKATLLEEKEIEDFGLGLYEFSAIIVKYVEDGYECMDYGSATLQLCIKKQGDKLDKIMIAVSFDQIPLEELLIN